MGAGAEVTATTAPVGGPAEQNAVTEWAMIVQPAIHTAGEPPRPPASSLVLHTIVQLAVYDAVMAIEGGYRPYHTALKAPSDADLRAAVATAAYRAARGRVTQPEFAYLDDKYGAYMAAIADGPPKQHGIEVGEATAAGILTLRADDGFNNEVTFQCSALPLPAGEFEPDDGCRAQPVDRSRDQGRHTRDQGTLSPSPLRPSRRQPDRSYRRSRVDRVPRRPRPQPDRRGCRHPRPRSASERGLKAARKATMGGSF